MKVEENPGCAKYEHLGFYFLGIERRESQSNGGDLGSSEK